MNVFLPYNRDTILTNARKINGIALTLGTIAAASFLGSLTYQIVGWPHGRLASLIILVAAFFIAERVTHVLKPQKLAPLNGPFIFLNTCLAIGYLVLGFYLVSHATPVWIGSVFQAVPRRILALFGFLSIAVVLLHSRKLLASINQFLFWLFIFGFTALVFRTGFGFDIFVHDATVRAWQSAGFIAPRSFLYGGFYSIVAALSTLSGARPLFIINWITPIVGALVFLYASLQRKSIIFSLLFLASFQQLFTTATPQALGHLLFIFVILLFWISDEFKTATPLQLILFVLGIGAIHPISGIAAAAVVGVALSTRYFKNWWQKIAIALCGAALAILPAALIFYTSPGAHFIPITLAQTSTLFFSSKHAFQVAATTRLAYAFFGCIPLIIFGLGIWSIAAKKVSRNAQALCVLALGAISSAIFLRALALPQIISYEQADFANRLVLTAVLLTLPAVTEFLESLRAPRTTIAALILLSASSWFVAQIPWNSLEHTKAIQVSAPDFEIVQSIDTRAAGKKYIVLADQTTSAAALYEFGFLQRQLAPPHTFYFYPIPTGDVLYSQYFLPQTYNGITRGALTNAATAAGVRDVYFVIKPYWQASDAVIQTLKSNTTDWWTVGGAVVGHLNLNSVSP